MASRSSLRSSKRPQCLELPEIVANVVQHIIDEADLFACVQVNKLWAEEATSCLWEPCPPVEILASFRNLDRIQYYANKIRFLKVCDYEDVQILPQLSTISFPRLTRLTVDAAANEKRLLPFLQPGLRKFEVFSGIQSDAFLMQLRKQCPQLKLLSIGEGGRGITADALLEFLSSTPSLRTLNLPCTMTKAESDAVLLHLATRSSLKRYFTTKLLTEDLLSEAQKLTDLPFHGLRILDCWAASKAIMRLLPFTPSLRGLNLQLIDSSTSVFPALENCTKMEELVVEYGPDTFIAPDTLVALSKRCQRLVHLKIQPRETISTGPALEDVDIERITAALPQLHFLRLHVKSALTIQAVMSLGDHCKQLTHLYLHGRFDISRLGDGPRLFKNLKNLCLDTVAANMFTNVETIAAILNHHAPILISFHGFGGPVDTVEIIKRLTMRQHHFRPRQVRVE